MKDYGKGGAKPARLWPPRQGMEMTMKSGRLGLAEDQGKGAKRSCFDTPPVAKLIHLATVTLHAR
jgi:hypothetical protein